MFAKPRSQQTPAALAGCTFLSDHRSQRQICEAHFDESKLGFTGPATILTVQRIRTGHLFPTPTLLTPNIAVKQRISNSSADLRPSSRAHDELPSTARLSAAGRRRPRSFLERRCVSTFPRRSGRKTVRSTALHGHRRANCCHVAFSLRDCYPDRLALETPSCLR